MLHVVGLTLSLYKVMLLTFGAQSILDHVINMEFIVQYHVIDI